MGKAKKLLSAVLISSILLSNLSISMPAKAVAADYIAPDTVSTLDITGMTVRASSVFDERNTPVSSIIDGNLVCPNFGEGDGWVSALMGDSPEWVEVSFGEEKTIDTINVIGVQENYNSTAEPTLYQFFTTHGLTKFAVQYWDAEDDAWKDVPGGRVNENINVWRQFRFYPITTEKVRVIIYEVEGGKFAALAEIQALEASGPKTPQPGENIALLSNRSRVTASSTFSPEYDPMTIVSGDRRGYYWGAYGGWMDGTKDDFTDDSVTVEFDSTYTIDTVNVYGLQDTEGVEPTLEDVSRKYALVDFDVLYRHGESWNTIAEIRGNNKVWNFIHFDPIEADAVKIVVHNALGGYSRIAQVEVLADSPENYLSSTNEAYLKDGLMFHATMPVNQEANKGNRLSPSAEHWMGSGFNGALYFETTQYNTTLAKDLKEKYNYDLRWGMVDFQDATTRGVNMIPEALADTDSLNTISINDEIYYTERARQETAMNFEKIRSIWPHVLTHTNQIGSCWGNGGIGGTNSEVQWETDDLRYYIRTAKPDILTYDDYVFSEDGTEHEVNYRILERLKIYRDLSLEGWDGTGRQPISFGQYILGYKPGSTTYQSGAYEMTESQLNLVPYMTLTMGGKWMNMFRWEYNQQITDPMPGVFLMYDEEGNLTRYYDWYKDLADEVANLSPHLSRLSSDEVRFVQGYVGSERSKIPDGMELLSGDEGSWLMDVQSASVGDNNAGNPGDVVVGWFDVLPGTDRSWFTENCGGNSPEYFMVNNATSKGNGGTGTGKQEMGSCANSEMKITLHFDFDGNPGMADKLRMVNRQTGKVEPVELTHVAGDLYAYAFLVEGGQAELFFFENSEDSVPAVQSYPKRQATIEAVADGTGDGGFTNLVRGRTDYTWQPAAGLDGGYGGYPDTGNCEATDGKLALTHDDSGSYGWYMHHADFNGTRQVTGTFPLGGEFIVNTLRFNRVSAASLYDPTSVEIFSSKDGINYGSLGEYFFEDAPGIMTTVSFPAVSATHIQLVFHSNRTNDWMFMDEIELGYKRPLDNSAAGVADNITGIVSPALGQETLNMPLAEGFTVSLKASSATNIINLNGKIIEPDRESVVAVTLLVTNDKDGSDTAQAGPFLVTVPSGKPLNNYSNLIAGKSYEESAVSGAVKAPEYAGSLTDGVKQTDQSSLLGWKQFTANTSEALTVTFDLGSEQTVDRVKVWSPGGAYKGYRPNAIKVKVSTDGKNYTNAGGVNSGEVVEGGDTVIDFTSQSARYVQFLFDSRSDWIMVGEAEAYNTGSLPKNAEGWASCADYTYEIPDKGDQLDMDGLRVRDPESGELLDLPSGYSASIAYTSDPAIIALDGKINRQDVKTPVALMFEIKDDQDATALTNAFLLNVPPAGIIDADYAAELITGIDAPAKGDTALVLPSVTNGFTLSIANTTHHDVIDSSGAITNPQYITEVGVTLEVINNEDAGDKALAGPFLVSIPASDAEDDPGEKPDPIPEFGNLAFEKLYEVSAVDDAEKADAYAGGLTDGVKQSDMSSLLGWKNFTANTPDALTVTLDLGSVQTIDRTTVWSPDGNNAKYRPNAIKIRVSTDGKSYTDAGYADAGNVVAGGDTVIDFTSQSARYVQFLFDSREDWIMLGEVEVYDSARLTESLPDGYSDLVAGDHTYGIHAGPDLTIIDSRPDTGGLFTDGILVGKDQPDSDWKGYKFPNGQTDAFNVEFNLGVVQWINEVKVWVPNTGNANYMPKAIRVEVKESEGAEWTSSGSASTIAMGQFSVIRFGDWTKAKYVRIWYSATGDWIAVDDIQVYGIKRVAPSNSVTDVASKVTYSYNDESAIDFNTIEIPDDFSITGLVSSNTAVINEGGEIAPASKDTIVAIAFTVSDSEQNTALTNAFLITVKGTGGEGTDKPEAPEAVGLIPEPVPGGNLLLGRDYSIRQERIPAINDPNFNFYGMTSYPDSERLPVLTDGRLAQFWNKGETLALYANNYETNFTYYMEVIFDLGSETDIGTVMLSALRTWYPYDLTFVELLTSTDGENYTKQAETAAPGGPSNRWYSLPVNDGAGVSARYLKLVVNASAYATWIFLDEVMAFAPGDAPDYALAAPTPADETTNVALEKSYVRSAPVVDDYWDIGEQELTDGRIASKGSVQHDLSWLWSGMDQNYSVTLDLENECEINWMDTGFLSQLQSGIAAPRDVTYSYSMDGKTFTELGKGKLYQDVVTDTPGSELLYLKTLRSVLALEEPVVARYVRAEVHNCRAEMVFQDEFRVFGVEVPTNKEKISNIISTVEDYNLSHLSVDDQKTITDRLKDAEAVTNADAPMPQQVTDAIEALYEALFNSVKLGRGDANLSGITLSKGTLSPAFDPEETTYSVTVPNDVESITIGATTSDAGAKVTGTGEKALSVGANAFTLMVTAQNGTTRKVYTVIVVRRSSSGDPSAKTALSSLTVSTGTLTPAFDPDTIVYTVTVPNSVSSLTIDAEAFDPNATVSGAGDKTLNVGTNPFTITVTAQDGVTKLEYTVIAIRENQSGGIEPPSETIKPALTNKTIAYIAGYEDGTVRPEAKITRAEVAQIFYNLLTDESKEQFASTSNSFSDVRSNHWANEPISVLAKAEVLSGYENGTFRPGNNITRAELVSIVAKFADVTDWPTDNPFSDVDSDHWAIESILYAAGENWVSGYEDGTFRPSNDITRAEAISIINGVLGRDAGDVAKITNMKTWPDNADTDKWYYNAVQLATNSY